MKNFAVALSAITLLIASAAFFGGPATAQSSPCNPAVQTCL